MKCVEYPRLDERVYRAKLPNGLTLAVVPRQGFQKKLAYFVTDYGSVHTAYSLDGQALDAPAGVAHYLEHKLFDMPRGEISGEFAAMGANVNAFTGYDMTAYHFSCTDRFEESLRLLLEFVSTPYFTAETVEKEQGIIGQEIDMTADNPEVRVFENLVEAMYPSHPIRIPILGTRESISRITPEVLRSCHRAFYHPENMMLCVVGDVDARRVEALALEVLGSAPVTGGKKLRPWTEEMTCGRKEVSASMEVAMPMFQLGFKCEPGGTGEEAVRREIIGELAAEALMGESSPLYLELYESGLIDGSFGGGLETLDGIAMFTAAGDSEDPRAVRDAILRRARELVEQGIDPQDFLRMKRSALGRRIRELDSFDSLCFRLCAYQFTDFDYLDFPRIFERVEAEDLIRFIGTAVTEERCCLSVIWPKQEEETL